MPYLRQPVSILPAVTGVLRHVAESFILLAVAVMLFRGFFAEGFMISTGSMAPTLLGYHRRVVCPECHFEFARGASAENDAEFRRVALGNYDLGLNETPLIRCPNCAFTDIPFQELPRTEGDQLLVHKQAYELRDPRRWEVIVFRNPEDPRQAYVKRVAGLPGEQIEIREGEVFADGLMCRKPLGIQRAIKVPVSRWENRTPGDDPDARSGWQPMQPDSCWQPQGSSLLFQGTCIQPDVPIDWFGYRHWIRSGGRHQTRVLLSRWPHQASKPDPSISPLSYVDGELIYSGVLTDVERRMWLARTDDPEFHSAINQLYEQSHLSGIIDESGYNPVNESREHLVDEFFVSLMLTNVKGDGQFEIQLSDSEHQFSAILDFGKKECSLRKDGENEVLVRVPFPPSFSATKAHVEFSLVDKQATLALNGKEVFQPVPFERMGEPQSVTEPVRFGATQIDCTVTNIELSRDVYYVSKPNQQERLAQLGADEFFVLGDNSAVSVDSRLWERPGVPRRALIGKPLVVHLPSRTQSVNWNGTERHLRVPDFSRARVIR